MIASSWLVLHNRVDNLFILPLVYLLLQHMCQCHDGLLPPVRPHKSPAEIPRRVHRQSIPKRSMRFRGGKGESGRLHRADGHDSVLATWVSRAVFSLAFIEARLVPECSG